MKPLFFYLILVLLFLLIPIGGIGFLGTMLTEKYQIENDRISLEVNTQKFTEQEIQEEINNIESLEKSVLKQQILMITIATIGLISAILLIKNRKRIIKNSL